jgi:hypothetical protein
MNLRIEAIEDLRKLPRFTRLFYSEDPTAIEEDVRDRGLIRDEQQLVLYLMKGWANIYYMEREPMQHELKHGHGISIET